MLYKEIEGYVPFYKTDAYFVNYIDADFHSDGELALEFEDNFHIKEKLKEKYGTYTSIWANDLNPGFCISEGKVFSLVIKKNKYDQETFNPFRIAMYELFLNVQELGCKKLIFPKYESEEIWEKIKQLIMDTFKDLNVEVEVYGLSFEKDESNIAKENMITSVIEEAKGRNSINLIKPVSLIHSSKNRCKNNNSFVLGKPGAGKKFYMNKNEVENERKD